MVVAGAPLVAVDVLIGPDGRLHVELPAHRDHGVVELLVHGDEHGLGRREVRCGCGDVFVVGAIRPAPLVFVVSPDWDDDVDGQAPTRPGWVPAC